MNRLSTRLLASHALVAAIAGLTAYVLVRVLAPQIYDQNIRTMMGRTRDQGMGMGLGVREVAVTATNNAVLIGALAGVLTALVAGAWSARRILKPLADVSAATRRLAEGHYDERVELPREPELAAVAADVNALALRLADTEARRARLLGEVAHEMRTPLTVLDGYVEGLIDGVFEPGPETLAELGGELRRLRRLADDLAALSRADERGFDLRPERLDLVDVAVRAAERLRPQLEDAGISLAIIPDDGGPSVRGDADRLAQVLTNLLGNALAATPRGGHVQVVGHHDASSVRVSVTDTGVGLGPADLTRVFERFYRVPTDSPNRRSSGTGIGLTIARGIARAHGGDLVATSPGPGQGATFTLNLPAAT